MREWLLFPILLQHSSFFVWFYTGFEHLVQQLYSNKNSDLTLAVTGGEGVFRIQIEIKILMEDRKNCIPSSSEEC